MILVQDLTRNFGSAVALADVNLTLPDSARVDYVAPTSDHG